MGRPRRKSSTRKIKFEIRLQVAVEPGSIEESVLSYLNNEEVRPLGKCEMLMAALKQYWQSAALLQEDQPIERVLSALEDSKFLWSLQEQRFLRPIHKEKNLIWIMLSSLFCSFVALGIILVCTYSNALPDTVFPDSVVTRPWDIAALFLFLFAGFVVFPRFYYRYPSLFSYSLIISTIPQVATQIHMAFGSTELFDNNFNIAHFLKIIAYLVPVIGLSLDYVRTYRQEVDTTKQLEKAIGVFDSILLEDHLH